MLIATCDFSNGWSFEGDAFEGFALHFVDGNETRLYPAEFSFGWSASVNGEQSGEFSWPPEGVVVQEIDATQEFFGRFYADPDDSILLRVWAKKDSVMVEDEIEFSMPRPPQPYPSWEWNEYYWKSPVPPPTDGKLYDWDEAKQNWVLVI